MKLKIVILDLEIPPRVRRWALNVAVPLAVLLGGGTVAYASGLAQWVITHALRAATGAFPDGGPALVTWSAGQTLQAADLNQNFSAVEEEVSALQDQLSTLPGSTPLTRTPLQIAELQWYAGVTIPTVTSGGTAYVAFDGANIWATNASTQSVSRIQVNSHTVDTFATDVVPYGIAFDGANIWVAGFQSSTVSKLQVSDGGTVGTYPIGGQHGNGVAFDGTNIWVTYSTGVSQLTASTGALVTSYTGLTNPQGLAFDGTHMWVANFNSGNSSVTEITPVNGNDGGSETNTTVSGGAFGVAFDGTNIWVTGATVSNKVTKILASTGAVVTTYSIGTRPEGIAFDGTNIWVADTTENIVTKLSALTGAVIGTYPVGATPEGVAFDGTHLWVANTSGSVTEL